MTDHCSPYCPFLACDGCPYQGGKSTLSVLSEDGAGLGRREQGGHPYSRLHPTDSHEGRAAMNATHERGQPQTIGQIFATWMASADGCDCGNTQPPDACIPSATPGMAFRCHYRCDDCGATWTRAYPPAKEMPAA